MAELLSGNAVYDNPQAGTPYSTPTNKGGNVADVSHWIVCGPPPFDWNWQYEAPSCTALVVVYPEDIPAGLRGRRFAVGDGRVLADD